MLTWILVFLLYSWKMKNFISKIRRSKVTDYAALNMQLTFRYKKKCVILLFGVTWPSLPNSCKPIIFCCWQLHFRSIMVVIEFQFSSLQYILKNSTQSQWKSKLPNTISKWASLAGGEVCLLLITFANSLNADQDRKNAHSDHDPNCLTL